MKSTSAAPERVQSIITELRERAGRCDRFAANYRGDIAKLEAEAQSEDDKASELREAADWLEERL